MTKNDVIKAIQFVPILMTCKQINFGTVRKLRAALEGFKKVTTEYEELLKVETEDKEDGLQKFVDEPYDFEPIPAELFDSVEHENTGAYMNNDPNQIVTFLEVVQILEVLKVIK